MKLLIEKTGTSFSVPDTAPLLIGNSSECQLQINHPQVWGCHARIQKMSYGYILEIESALFTVNGIEIRERCLLYSGDELMLADIRLLMIDNNYVPLAVKESHNKEVDADDMSQQLSSVFGLRYLNGINSGSFIRQEFKHDSGWSIQRAETQLIFKANNAEVFVNGQSIDSAIMQNGDTIVTAKDRFRVESPGHSGYSKFSPSHPRNVQLSESIRTKEETSSRHSWVSRLRPHLWWITLIVGMSAIIGLAYLAAF